MSMTTYPNHGYTVQAAALATLIETDYRDQYETALRDMELGDALILLDANLPGNFPPVRELYALGSEDESEDLLPGIVYAVFEHDKLFEAVRTPAHNNLRLSHINPTESTWTTFS